VILSQEESRGLSQGLKWHYFVFQLTPNHRTRWRTNGEFLKCKFLYLLLLAVSARK
jgi:hypothetical protein